MEATARQDDPLVIAGKEFRSRLILGTGKYRSMQDMTAAAEASGAEMITVAIRRLPLDKPDEPNLMDHLDWSRYHILPNTAGCTTVDEVMFTARLARELTGSNWLKLEVIPDAQYLLPDPIGTLRAAEQLIKEGFIVLPYIHADPILARHLQDLGCATVMPLGSPIGSGRGIFTLEEIQIIVENARVPVVVDAGLGAPSEASLALEIGADAVLVNTAIAQAQDPARMAAAFRLGVQAGRLAYLAGRIPRRELAQASSPIEGAPRPLAARQRPGS